MTKKLALGSVMMDIAGTSLTALEKEKIQHPNTGAVILFARNYQDLAQIKSLITAIRQARNGDILIAVDQEGGRVQRFQQGFTRLPAASAYLDKPELANNAGWLMAAELLSVGVDFSFAPVLDVDIGVSEIIGDRAFSNNPHEVSKLALEFQQGMRAAGMAATGKHFPGHGAVALDSHLDLPIDKRVLAEIRAQDLIPFQNLIAAGLEAIMPAHIVYSEVDPLPAGFSKFWLQQILRTELNFQGVIFSDDLSMKGAAIIGDFPQRAQTALNAGCDMVLVCNNPTAASEVLDAIPILPRADIATRLTTMLAKPELKAPELFTSKRWQQTVQQLQELINVN